RPAEPCLQHTSAGDAGADGRRIREECARRVPSGAPGPQNTAYSRQTMSQNHRPAAPAIDPTKKPSLFEVPFGHFTLFASCAPQLADDVRELKKSSPNGCPGDAARSAGRWIVSLHCVGAPTSVTGLFS